MEKIDEKEYKSFLGLVIQYNLTDPFQLIIKNKCTFFVQDYINSNKSEDINWELLIKEILNLKEEQTLKLLIPYVSLWDEKEINKIQKLLKNNKNILKEFEETFNNSIGKLNGKKKVHPKIWPFGK